MSQLGDVVVPKVRDSMFIHSAPVHLLRMLVSLLRVLQRYPRVFLPRLVILLLMGLRGATVRVGGTIMQLGSSLMILVMGSVVITSRHL